MQQRITLSLPPAEAVADETVRKNIAESAGVKASTVSGYILRKRSIDARGKAPLVNLVVDAFINEPVRETEAPVFHFKDVRKAAKKAVIIGGGPAGLFAALLLLEKGVKPVIIERGKEVRARRRDLALLNREGIVNPESNYCFGEGGAGTYSDGKLYTRSNKRGSINRILQLFVHFGASPEIMTDAHPHIGTNKLPQIITAMRKQIEGCGGEMLFEKKLTDFLISGNKISGAKTADGDMISADAFILATGHSARDIFYLLHEKQILIEPKSFAMGVRIEHPQALVDSIQYHCGANRDALLPPASYSLVQQVNGGGVFSFCMCPGGIIAPAATATGELVVNGWSPSRRNNSFANSGIVVQTELKNIAAIMKPLNAAADDPLIFMKFQQLVERRSFDAGGGNFVAPAQRMADFVNGKLSADLPVNSYLPGLASVQLGEVLPQFIYQSLAFAFKSFGKKMKGYLTNDAVITAVESRTSSPVRIPRNAETLQHPQLKNLFPCGEGAGYAGGIVSAAMDGERCANAICEAFAL